MFVDHLLKTKKEFKKKKKKGDKNYIYKIELDKACFQHDMAYGDFNFFRFLLEILLDF